MKDRFLLRDDSIAFLFQMSGRGDIDETLQKTGFRFFYVSAPLSGQPNFKKGPNHNFLFEM